MQDPTHPLHAADGSHGTHGTYRPGGTRHRRRRLALATALAALCLQALPTAQAADFPAKPIKLIVGFPPGGGADAVARIVGQKLADQLGQAVIVDNRPGATGLIAASTVAKSPADGYTLLLGHVNALAIAPAAIAKPPYDPVKDFQPIAYIGQAPNVLVVNPAVTQAASVKDLIALAKARPGALSYASPGVGSANHLAGEMFALATDTRLMHVPYKGSAPAITDLLAGQVSMNFDAITSVTAYIKDGKMRPLAVTTPRRSAALPEVPTLAELGLKDVNVAIWYAFMAPAGTPPAITQKLHAAANAALADATVKERLEQLGVEVAPQSIDQFSAQLKDDVRRYGSVVKARDIRMD